MEAASVVVPIRDARLKSFEYERATPSYPESNADELGQILGSPIRMEANSPAGIVRAIQRTGNSCRVALAIFAWRDERKGGIGCVLPGIFPAAAGRDLRGAAIEFAERHGCGI